MSYTPFARVDITCKGTVTPVFVSPDDIPKIKGLLTGRTQSFSIRQQNGPDLKFMAGYVTAVKVW